MQQEAQEHPTSPQSRQHTSRFDIPCSIFCGSDVLKAEDLHHRIRTLPLGLPSSIDKGQPGEYPFEHQVSIVALVQRKYSSLDDI